MLQGHGTSYGMANMGQRVLLGQRASSVVPAVSSDLCSTQQRRYASKRVNTSASERVKPAAALGGRRVLRAQLPSKPRDVSVANHQHYGPVSFSMDHSDLANEWPGQDITLLHQCPLVERLRICTHSYWC